MDVLQPVVVIGAAIVAIIGLVFGLLRRDPPTTILLDVAGYLTFLLALGWAQSMGEAVFWTAGAASLGTLMYTFAAGRRTAARLRAELAGHSSGPERSMSGVSPGA